MSRYVLTDAQWAIIDQVAIANHAYGNRIGNGSIATDAKYAVRSGIWFWVNHDLGRRADGGGTRITADSISTVINAYDGTAGFTNRCNYMREILDAGTFKNVCFNKSLATRNEKAWHPFGNNGR